MRELKICPFCGGKAELKHPDYEYYSPSWFKCTQCGAEGPTKASELEAQEAWNRRAQERFDKWISVKDDLPKEFGEPCIVYNGSSVQYGDYYSNGEWYTPDCYESEEIRGVTHWMPLPEQPKEENSGNEQHMP